MASTVLAPPATAGPREALPLPSTSDVVRLQSVTTYPSVSLLLTTTPAARMTDTDAVRLDGLVRQAVARLSAECPPAVTDPLARRLRGLAEDTAGRRTRAAVALYAAATGKSSAWSLPVQVRDRVVVDPTFATRDLVRSLHRTPRHLVLLVAGHEAQLLDGSGDVLLPAVGGAFPLRANPTQLLRGRPLASRPRGPGVRGAPAEEDDETFLRAVDAALGAYLRLHPAPLVVAGARHTVARFLRLSRNTERLAGVLHGNHLRTPSRALASLVRPVLDAYLRARQDEAVALLDTRRWQGRVATGMPSVWLASRTEHPQMLIVEQGYFYPARLSTDGDLLTPAMDVDHPEVIDDAVDEVIETVLRRGGWVALVDNGALDHCDRIALTLRSRRG